MRDLIGIAGAIVVLGFFIYMMFDTSFLDIDDDFWL